MRRKESNDEGVSAAVTHGRREREETKMEGRRETMGLRVGEAERVQRGRGDHGGSTSLGRRCGRPSSPRLAGDGGGDGSELEREGGKRKV